MARLCPPERSLQNEPTPNVPGRAGLRQIEFCAAGAVVVVVSRKRAATRKDEQLGLPFLRGRRECREIPRITNSVQLDFRVGENVETPSE